MSGAPTRPLVTVAIPVHNGGSWLRDAAGSVLAQTFGDLELIIADTVSNDETRSIAEELAAADPRVRYLRSESYRGLTENHLAALEPARGAFFCWLAADDAMRPELLARCLAAFEQRPELLLVVPGAEGIDERWTLHSPTPPLAGYRDDTLSWDGPRPWRRFVNAIRQLHECNAFSGLFRVEALRSLAALGAYQGSDRVLLTEIVLAGPALQLPERLQLRRVHPGQVSRTLTSDRAERLFNRRLPRRAYVESLNLFVEHLGAVRRSRAPLADRAICVGAMFSVWWLVRRFYLPGELRAYRASRRRG